MQVPTSSKSQRSSSAVPDPENTTTLMKCPHTSPLSSLLRYPGVYQGITPSRPGVGGARVRRSGQSVDLYSRRLGVPLGLPVITLVVALLMIHVRTVEFDALGLPARYSAPTPATCGLAIEVPLMVL